MLWNRFIGRKVAGKPTSFQNDTALRGWKRAEIHLDHENEVRFKALASDAYYKVESDAECLLMEDIADAFDPSAPRVIRFIAQQWAKKHKLVGRACTCGFYAYADRSEAELHEQPETTPTRAALIEVAISGKFMQYKKGYRYAHQRVTKVIIGKCSVDDACDEQATSFLKMNQYTDYGVFELMPACRYHVAYISVTRFSFAEISEKFSSQTSSDKFKPIVLETANGDEPWLPPAPSSFVAKGTQKERKHMITTVILCGALVTGAVSMLFSLAPAVMGL